MTGLEIGLVAAVAWLLARLALGAPNKRTRILGPVLNPGYVL